MSEILEKPTFLRRLWLRLDSLAVQNTPDETSICFFDCDKPKCPSQHWKDCKRRLSGVTGMPPAQ